MDEYPKWIKATVPGAGEVPLVAQSKAEEDAVLDGTAVFKITQRAPEAGGAIYSIELPQAKAKKAQELEPVKAKAKPVPKKAKHR